MAEHTSGPWEVTRFRYRKNGQQCSRAAVLSASRNEYIATDICGGDATEANARLIAAAPALLEALYDIRHMCGSDDAHINLRAGDAIKLAGHDPLAAAKP